jgi:energy-dependent translational throttle protein EttA
MSDDKKVIFSMSGVTKTYKTANTPVLKNIYLSFFYGAKIGILGLNGSGKSTLLRRCCFLSRIQSGLFRARTAIRSRKNSTRSG